MTLPDWLLEILVCPARRDLKLRLVQGKALDALNERIEEGKARNQRGDIVRERVEEALLREDGLVLYPIREGIPVLIAEEGILLEPGEVK